MNTVTSSLTRSAICAPSAAGKTWLARHQPTVGDIDEAIPNHLWDSLKTLAQAGNWDDVYAKRLPYHRKWFARAGYSVICVHNVRDAKDLGITKIVGAIPKLRVHQAWMLKRGFDDAAISVTMDNRTWIRDACFQAGLHVYSSVPAAFRALTGSIQ